MKLISLALLVCGVAQGVCPAVVPPNQACVKWTASSGWTNGTSYAPGTVITYTVYIVSPTMSTAGKTTGLFLLIPALPKGEKCFVVTTTVNDPILGTIESIRSNSACKVIRFPSPTDGKIVGPTDGSIELKN